MSFRYDPLGRRNSKTSQQLLQGRPSGNAVTTRFVWEGYRLLQEIHDGIPLTYVYSDSQSYEPLARIDGVEGPEIYWFHTAANGMPERLTDSEGRVSWEGLSTPWGKLLSESNQRVPCYVQNLRLQGQYLDRETGLHYSLFRYYNPDSARFTQQDPIGLAGGMNLYAYAPNPYGWVDPLGLTKCGAHYGELDHLGRPTGVKARLNASDINTGSHANPAIQPPGFITGAGSNRARGHLLGRQLGGSGDDVRNLVTIQHRPVNTTDMSSVEGRIRKALERGETVDMSVTPIYKGPSRIPAGITIHAEGNRGFFESLTLLNPPGM